MNLSASNLSKSFDRKLVFQNINFNLTAGQALAVTGRNGSGKSTLIKILSNTLSPSSGEMNLLVDGKKIKKQDFHKFIGVVSPYLNFYEEFTASEILKLTAKIRGIPAEGINELLDKVGLLESEANQIRIFSTGMKQRLKFAFALLHQPDVLLLDEPTTNLDEEGIRFVTDLIRNYNGIVVIATNSAYEKSLCQNEIKLGD